TGRAAVSLGLAVASLPLIHGGGAAAWLYAIGPIVTMAAHLRAPRPWRALPALSLAGVGAVLILWAYGAAGHASMTPAEEAWTRNWQAGYAPPGSGWELLLTAPDYLRSYGGSAAAGLGLAAAGILLVKRRFMPALGLGMVAILLCCIIANAR